MNGHNRNGSRAACARGFVALWVMLAIGLGFAASPAAAAPFAYVANSSDNTVSVIDTGTNTVVATVPIGTFPIGVAVAPDGKHAYVTNFLSNNVSVIDTASNTVVAMVPVGPAPSSGVAITLAGKHVYVANSADFGPVGAGSVSVIDTATNTVEATVPLGSYPTGVAVAPDGKYAYVANDLPSGDRHGHEHRGGHGRGGD
jgi:YVTN family beta-propeller protein